MSNFINITELNLPIWLNNSPVLTAVKNINSNLESDLDCLVEKDFLPITLKNFQLKHQDKKIDEINFLYFIHYLRIMDFWDIIPSEYPICLTSYFYCNRNTNYREKIPMYLLKKLNKFSFGKYIGLRIDFKYLTCFGAEMGNIEFLKYLFSKRCKMNKYTFQTAVESNNLHICKFLFNKGCRINSFITAAAKNVDILEFMVQKYPNTTTSHVITNAVKIGNLEMVICANKYGCKITKYAINEAIYGDHLEIFKYFINNKFCFINKIKRKVYDTYLEYHNNKIMGYVMDYTLKKKYEKEFTNRL